MIRNYYKYGVINRDETPMLSFTQFITEATHTGGIAHIEHPSDRSFDSQEAAHHALETLRGVARGKTPSTRKIDDRMSFHVIRTPDGKIGVKYKGAGSHYNYSAADIEKQHGHKPYLVGPLKALHAHLGKVIPKTPGEYQGGYMSEPSGRSEYSTHISHAPNTIEYRAEAGSEEAKKLKRSKVSVTIHTELKGPERTAHPITDMSHFQSHPDVHMVQHLVSDKERKLPSAVSSQATEHLDAAEKLMKGHTYDHLSGHETHLRTYINRTVSSGEKPSVEGYRKHLQTAHQKLIDAVKTPAAKERKTATMNTHLSQVDANKKHFQKSFQIHHHLQQATNHLARGLDRAGGGGFSTHINGAAAGGEGYVAHGLKVVDREGFSKANRERSAILRASKGK